MKELEIEKRDGRTEQRKTGESKEQLEGDILKKVRNREQKHEVSEQEGSMMDRQNDKH